MNFTSEEIYAIEQKNYRIEECCQEFLQRWLDGFAGNQVSITWETLLLAMADAECVITQQVWKALTSKGKSELYNNLQLYKNNYDHYLRVHHAE